MRHTLWMWFAVGTLACQGEPGAPGAQGIPGEDGTPGHGPQDPEPAIGFVYPDTLLLGRSADVALTFHDAALDGEATVDFGDDIDVVALEVVSPTTLYASLDIAEEAQAGVRDVVVDLGDRTLTFEAGVEVSPAVRISLSRGASPAQGLMAELVAENLDPDHEFDCGINGGFFASANVFFEGRDLWGFSPSACSPTQMTATVLWAPKALAAARTDVIIGSQWSPRIRFVGEALQVAAQSATALQPGVAVENQNLGAPLASNLYSFAATGSAIATVTIEKVGSYAGAWPTLMSFDAGGSFDDLVGWPFPTPTGTRVRYPVTASRNQQSTFVYFDGYLGGGDASVYGYRIVADVQAVPPERDVVEVEPNDSDATAALLDPSAPLIVSGSFADDADVDVYRLALDAGDKLDFNIDADTRFSWRIGGSYNTRAYVARLSSGTFTAPAAGTYSLIVRPIEEVGNASDYALTLQLQ